MEKEMQETGSERRGTVDGNEGMVQEIKIEGAIEKRY